MAHATPKSAPAGAPAPLDPEHDVNGKATTVLVAAFGVCFFLTFWLMVPIFDRMLEQERKRKIDEVPTEELDAVKETEFAFLKGKNGRDIGAVMKELAGKK